MDGTCPIERSNGGPAYSLENLEEKVEEAASSLLPSWWTFLVEAWKVIEPASHVGGLIALCLAIHMIRQTICRACRKYFGAGCMRSRGERRRKTPTAPEEHELRDNCDRRERQ